MNTVETNVKYGKDECRVPRPCRKHRSLCEPGAVDDLVHELYGTGIYEGNAVDKDYRKKHGIRQVNEERIDKAQKEKCFGYYKMVARQNIKDFG